MLSSLLLSSNNISQINFSSDSGMISYVSYLSFSRNNLSYVQNGTFDSLVNLKFFFLAGNRFGKINDTGINRLPSLIHISLSNNELQHLSLSELNNCPNLTNVYVHYNQIQDIDLKSDHRKLRVLYIGGNQISKIDATEVSFKNTLEDLWVPNNLISNFSWLSDFSSLKYLNIDAKSPQFLLPGNFQELNLLKTLELANVNDFIFQNFCSYLSNLPNLTEINFYKSSSLTNVDPNAFNCENKLITLKISQSNLTTIPNNFLSRFNQLRAFHLSNNQLTHLDSNVFQGANNLRNVYLNGNNLTSTYTTISYYNFTGFTLIPSITF